MSNTTETETYDAVVVGSGAGGGMAAFILATAGMKVLMLEAGRSYDPVRETPMFNLPEEAPLHDAATPDKPFGFFDATVNGGWDVPGEPYTQGSTAPEQRFEWWRARMLGGRTNHWGRISLRMGEYDFKPYSRDGLGFDWPIGYEDLAPYYDKTESLIGIFGSNEGLENTPDSAPGVLQAPPHPRTHELLVTKACRELGIPSIPSHVAVLSEKQDHINLPKKLFPDNVLAQKVTGDSMASRSACFWATSCLRGCSIKANFQSTTVLIPPALATGNLTIVTDAMVKAVTVDGAGRATGVNYIDKTSGREKQARARVVVLAASAAETARIMLNSRSASFPTGIANSSGLVGRYLMDTVGAKVFAQFPALEGLPPINEDGASLTHMYIPWWLYQEQLRGELDFPRGYHIEYLGGRIMPFVGLFDSIGPLSGGLYGKAYKEACRRYYGSFISFSGRGEMIPNENSYCEIDSRTTDQWGIPVLKFHWQWSQHELKQAAHMHQSIASIVKQMGGRPLTPIHSDGARAISPGGSIIHEVGTARMGSDPKTSVLNEYCQAWDVPNLFVADGAPFVSSPDKNPTLTILALAWRTCDHIVAQYKQGDL